MNEIYYVIMKDNMFLAETEINYKFTKDVFDAMSFPNKERAEQNLKVIRDGWAARHLDWNNTTVRKLTITLE